MRSLLRTLFLASFSAACGPIYYAPNTVHAPMIAAKHQGTAAVHFGDHNSFDIQASYSPASHLGIIFDGFRADVDGTSSGAGSGGGHLVEFGAGYYTGERFLWDVYGLAAFGHVENEFSPRTISAGLARYGAQSSFGYRSRFFDVFGAARLVGLTYSNIRGTDAAEIAYLSHAGTQMLLEPALILRGGYRLKAQLQVVTSHNLSDSSFKQEDSSVTFGVVYSFGK